ncbi:MAG: NUDIX hydrolase [Pseudomonadota bacterium]
MEAPADVPIRDAATVIVLREGREGPRVLMGQRGAKAAFMPSKFVFPGGAVDVSDAYVEPATALRAEVEVALQAQNLGPRPSAIAAAAVRELWEEAGLPLSTSGTAPVAQGWDAFCDGDKRPHFSPLSFIFRAVTPPGRPRRFDARFFFVNADAFDVDLDDFTHAEDELSHLSWIGLREARDLPLPFITEIVLAEVEDILDTGPDGREIPFFNHGAERSHVSLLKQA